MNSLQQLPLDFFTQSQPSLSNFIIGCNQELLETLRLLAEGKVLNSFIYIWGEPACGKTHLLNALAHARVQDSCLLNAAHAVDEFQLQDQINLYLIDDCEQLSEVQQEALFHLFNDAQASKRMLVACGAMPARLLPVREDLKTRFAWGLIYQLHLLTDEEKLFALSQLAQNRGLSISNDVLKYLIEHFHRDMQSLVQWIDALDRFSLITKRAVTLPLLRQFLQYTATHNNDVKI